MVEFYSNKVCGLSKSFTPIEVSREFGVTDKTIINRCTKLTSNSFLVPNVVKERIRSHSLSGFTRANEKQTISRILR